MPFVIAQIFGLTSQYAGKTWIVDVWLRHYDQALPGVLRIFMHTGLALIPISMPLILSCFRRQLFWVSIAALFLLAVCSMLFSEGIPEPLQEHWRLSTLGSERHLLRGIPAADFLPLWLNHPLFVLSLFSFGGIIVKLIDVVRAPITQPLGLFLGMRSAILFL